MSGRRVAISGLGVVSACGHDSPSHWRAMVDGHSAIGPLDAAQHGELGFSNAAQVRGWNATDWFDERALLQIDRFTQFLIVAAQEAVTDAGIEGDSRLAERTAVLTGTGLGGKLTEDEGYFELYRNGRPRVNPLTIPRAMANAGASELTMKLGIGGPGLTIATACSSSGHAIGLAYWMVRHGMVDLAVTGGSEAAFSWGHLKAWETLRVIAPDTCRPFSRDRKGMILGEGAAVIVLEPLDVARARGATVYAEIAGFGMSSDGQHLTQPSADGAARAMRAALSDADLRPEEVGYINAHGTGTPSNDPTETRAIRMAFGEQANHLCVSSTKSMHGHTLGAAGAIEAVTTALALKRKIVPPTANFSEPDPLCDLDVVANRARPLPIAAALSNSFAFGGLNAVLAFRSAEEG